MGQHTGILGGTFDPIHLGHLRIAVEALEQLELDRVLFIPCKIPVHKSKAHASPEARCHMVELAIQHEPQFQLDMREIESKLPSYTIYTLRALKQEFPDDFFYLILGSDSLTQFEQWYLPKKILSLSKIIVFKRTNCDTIAHICENLKLFKGKIVKDKDQFKKLNAGFVFPMQNPIIEISSSMIRQKIKMAKNIRYLVPEQVWNVIHNQHYF